MRVIANRRRRKLLIAFLLIICGIFYHYASLPGIEVAVSADELNAVLFDDQLQINIPINNSTPGSLTVDLIDATDKLVTRNLSHADRNQSSGRWLINLKLPSKLAREDLIWYRLRYRFIPSNGDKIVEEIRSMHEIFSYPVVKLLGQRELFAGSTGSLRLIAVNGRNGETLSTGELSLSLKTPGYESEVIKSRLDNHGTAEPQLQIPDGFIGETDLKIALTTPLGTQQIIEKVKITRRNSILLTVDRPIYQPGHLVYIRSLALDRFTHKAAAQQLITFEIEDAKGNKVFKKLQLSDEYGVASAEFQLAEEVNTGTFKLRAIMNDTTSQNTITQEQSFIVDRYVLPKFKINIALPTDGNGKQLRYFAPGETLTGKINAQYLFGKPVTRARVDLQLITDELPGLVPPPDAVATAFTDETGQYNFSLKLPAIIAGSQLNQGAAQVQIKVQVTDTANHSETHTETLLITNNQILITAVPESGEMIPNLPNKIYLVTSYPDGTPAPATLTGIVPVNNNQPAIISDKDGIAITEIDGYRPNLSLKAVDVAGKRGTAEIQLKYRDNNGTQLMVRTNRTLYKVGDSVDVTALSTKQQGSIYLDIIKDHQTMLTRALDLNEGKAKFHFDLTAEMFGAVEVRAYIIDKDVNIISDRRMIFIEPADDLLIATSLNKESYHPGEEAQIDIDIHDRLGRPKQAVLDLKIVDEAVFALSENRPGMEKIFFYLEEELLKPRYEIHSFNTDKLVTIDEHESADAHEDRERAAKVLLAAAKEPEVYSLKKQYGTDIFEKKREHYYEEYNSLINEKITRMISGLNRFYTEQTIASIDLSKDIERAIKQGYITRQDIVSPWGGAIEYQNQSSPDAPYYSASIKWPGNREAERFDINIYGVKVHQRVPFERQPYIGRLKFDKQADTQNKTAIIQGKILKDNGQPLRGATVKIRNSKGRITTRITDQNGIFKFNDLAPDGYAILINADNYLTKNYPQIELSARDQVDLEVALQRDVELTALYSDRAPNSLEVLGVNYHVIDMGIEGGVEGGVIGGMVGGVVGGVLGGVGVRNTMMAIKTTAEPPVLAGRPDIARRAEGPMPNEPQPDPQSNSSEEPEARERSYFPETLYINPALITDKNGHASVRIPLADSITTWRMTMLASTKQGALGSGTGGIRVFQDFFIDLDLPVALTQDDLVTIPVAVYNYLNDAQDVELRLKQDDWFTLVDDQLIKSVRVGANEVSAASYRIRANRIGSGKLTVTARLLNRKTNINGDTISRRVEVTPNGEQQNITLNDRLEGSVTREIVIPESALADASKILVKFYPGPASQMIEGLDSILRMPSGCFEQTSSSNYPNILVLDYMKTSKKITPEIQAKAEGFISLGYQKLVTYEVPGGGFSWFGQAPANKILTSYGLMEFADMAKVHDVDARIIQRTQQWLASQQKPDGSWDADKNFIDEGSTNNFHNDSVRIAGYIGWALAYSGYQGQAVERARQFINKNLTGQEDAYTLAIIANFAADYKQDRNWIERVIEMLIKKVSERDKQATWALSGQTPTHAHSDMAEIETTALAAQALLKTNRNSILANKALQYLTERKDAFGNWQSTQATILALKAFLLNQYKGSADTFGQINVRINGQQAGQIQLDQNNNDLLHQLDLKKFTTAGRNSIELNFSGKGALLYQIVGRYYLPWQHQQAKEFEPLSINIAYDRTKLSPDEMMTETVTVRNNLGVNADMIMVDLGIPPGFELQPEDIASLINRGHQQTGNILKYTITARQLILYFDRLQPKQTVKLEYRLKAKFPIKAKTTSSRIYEYYNPQIEAIAKPVDIQVER